MIIVEEVEGMTTVEVGVEGMTFVVVTEEVVGVEVASEEAVVAGETAGTEKEGALVRNLFLTVN
jgi:hypothetical protein